MALVKLQLHLSLLHFLPSDIAPPGSVENVLDCFNACLKNLQCVSLIYDRYNKQCYAYPGRLEVPFWGTDLNTDLDIYNTNRDGYGCPSHRGYDYNSTVNVCFKIHGGTKVTHIKATRTCNSEGGHLIRITSSAKDEFVSAVWPQNPILIDGRCTVDGGWKYSTGDNFTYFRWNINKPSANCPTSSECLETAVSGFNDISCWYDRPFMCEFDI
ncbi:aggrecan core protein-like [Haliotis rufescens]|uniref:aggrecan core protein-like n=1 Tax=Haliotis rufescens TaxID=6454 RepID=UPI00201F2812|nr:aggrecan core protein-like [Haliotis rufescens]XP_046366826.2 aggrecan core protein-like [Haliotis rufescens]